MTVEVDRMKSGVLTIDGSPLNHASAILTELENSHSEEVSVDVQITKEGEGAQSVERREEVVNSSEQSVTTTEEEEESDSEFEIIKEEEVTMSNGATTTTTTTTTRRRSERIKAHTECSAALFSDEEEPVEVEETPAEAERGSSESEGEENKLSFTETEIESEETTQATTELDTAIQNTQPLGEGEEQSKSEVASDATEETPTQVQNTKQQAAKERWSHLLVIFTISILIAVIANAIAYIHISRPEILQSLADRFSGLFVSSGTAEEGESPAEQN